MKRVTLGIEMEKIHSVRYKEAPASPNDPVVLGTVYVQKIALTRPYPRSLTVLLYEEGEEIDVSER